MNDFLYNFRIVLACLGVGLGICGLTWMFFEWRECVSLRRELNLQKEHDKFQINCRNFLYEYEKTPNFRLAVRIAIQEIKKENSKN